MVVNFTLVYFEFYTENAKTFLLLRFVLKTYLFQSFKLQSLYD